MTVLNRNMTVSPSNYFLVWKDYGRWGVRRIPRWIPATPHAGPFWSSRGRTHLALAQNSTLLKRAFLLNGALTWYRKGKGGRRVAIWFRQIKQCVRALLCRFLDFFRTSQQEAKDHLAFPTIGLKGMNDIPESSSWGGISPLVFSSLKLRLCDKCE